jgi:phosphohistidine phosphatase
MKLYVVRHAQAADESEDPQRHLTRKGRKDARALGKMLRKQKLRVTRIWHSGIPRAVETAEEIAPFLRGRPKLAKRPGLSPTESPVKIAKSLATLRDDVMIVGHEPFLAKLISQLVLSRPSPVIVHLRKPSIVCLERNDGDDEDDDNTESGWLIGWMLPVCT